MLTEYLKDYEESIKKYNVPGIQYSEKLTKYYKFRIKQRKKQIANLEKDFKFLYEHIPSVYGIDYGYYYREDFEAMIKEYNEDITEERMNSIFRLLDWTLEDILNEELPLINYRPDMSQEHNIPISNIPHFPFTQKIIPLKKQLFNAVIDTLKAEKIKCNKMMILKAIDKIFAKSNRG